MVAGIIGLLVIMAVTGWITIPRAEALAVDRESARMDAVGRNMLSLLGIQMQSWHELSATIARQVTERPYDGEAIFRSALEFNPTIVQLRVDSPATPDELTVLNPRFTSPLADPPDSAWTRLQSDSTFAVAWLIHTGADSVLVATRIPVRIRNRAFRLTTVWDATRFSAMLASVPLEPGCALHICAGRDTLWQSADRDSPPVERRIMRTPPSASGIALELAFPVQPIMREARESALSTTGIVLALAVALFLAGWWWLPRRR